MANIVIVDDDELIAEMAADTLMEAGHASGFVTNVADAREMLRWRAPDLILLDHDMPGITGGEFLREIRSSASFYDLPVIMFTRMAGKTDEDTARYNGAQDYIRKPFDPQSLVWKVERILEARAEREKHTSLEEYLAMAAGRFSYDASEKKRAI